MPLKQESRVKFLVAMRDPAISFLHVAPLDRRPSDAVRGLLLPWIAHMGIESMIEGLAVDVLRMFGQVVANGRGQI